MLLLGLALTLAFADPGTAEEQRGWARVHVYRHQHWTEHNWSPARIDNGEWAAGREYFIRGSGFHPPACAAAGRGLAHAAAHADGRGRPGADSGYPRTPAAAGRRGVHGAVGFGYAAQPAGRGRCAARGSHAPGADPQGAECPALGPQQFVVFGSISKLGTHMPVSVQVLDVETSRTDGIREVLCRRCTPEDMPEAVAKLAGTPIAGK